MRELDETDVKEAFADVLSEAQQEPVAIRRNGRRVAVMMPANEYAASRCTQGEVDLGQVVAANVSSGHSVESLSSILDSLDALVYVACMDTHAMIYINQLGQDLWGKPGTKKCHELLQDRDTPCPFCSNSKLVDETGEPTGVYLWEFQNLVTKQWYQCRDEAIRWPDGRLVRLEIATDITQRKHIEKQLVEANNQLQQLANTDVLTNCMNRRAFITAAEREVSHCRRRNSSFALALMDIDHFKKYNDKHGHAAGDEVLIKIAYFINNIIRKEDLFARFGGEEFILLLPATGAEESLQLLERIQEGIKGLSLDKIDVEVNLTMSFGLTLYAPDKHLDALIAQADQALYQAKANGRNRIETYGTPVATIRA